MSDTVEDSKRKLQELEQRIRAAKSSLGAKGEIVSEAQKDWDAMVETHADLRRKLEQPATSRARPSTASASTSTYCAIRLSGGWRGSKATSTRTPGARVAAEVIRTI